MSPGPHPHDDHLLGHFTTERVAIAMIDFAGFTATTDVHGDIVAATLATMLDDIAHREAAEGDDVVKSIGDAVLCSSPTPRQLLEWVTRILAHLNRHDRVPTVCVGAHEGTVIRREGDIFGATVNTAARLAELASPGTLVATDRLVDAAIDAGHAHIATELVTLKNIEEPVRVHRLRLDCTTCDPRWPIDPVCRMRVDPNGTPHYLGGERDIVFCSDACRDRYVAPLAP